MAVKGLFLLKDKKFCDFSADRFMSQNLSNSFCEIPTNLLNIRAEEFLYVF